MTELELRVWEYSVAIKAAKDRGETDVVEFMMPLHGAAVDRLLQEWGDGETETAA